MSGYSALSFSDLTARPAATVHLIAGRLCLDFVNSVGARRASSRGTMHIRDEKLTDYADIVAWGWHANVLTKQEAAALLRLATRRPGDAVAVHARAMRLRESIYQTARHAMVGARPRPDDLAVINAELQTARAARHLDWGASAGQWRWRSEPLALDRLLWSISESAAELFTEGDLSHLRQCGGDDCGWLFEDTSRNGRRRWCDMRDCGNVAKVRRYRAHRQHR